MSDKPTVLIHPPLRAFEKRLTDLYEPMHCPTDRRDITAAVAIGSIGIRNAVIEALPSLKTIACFGVGVDGLDLAHCRTHGITVTHGRDINHEDVADLAIGLLISVARRMGEGERVLRANAWKPPLAVPSQRRLKGMKLGIVGLGAIGKAVEERAAPFGIELAWTGPRPKPESALRYEPDLRAH
jgi:lactate dehydrogenase-like 2-hydroxyacid dehydrogenase